MFVCGEGKIFQSYLGYAERSCADCRWRRSHSFFLFTFEPPLIKLFGVEKSVDIKKHILFQNAHWETLAS